MTIQQKLSELKERSKGATKDGKILYTAPVGKIKQQLIESITESIEKSVAHDPTIPWWWVETNDGLKVAEFGCGPSSEKNALFFGNCSNSYDTLLDVIGVLSEALDEVAAGVKWNPETALKREANARREAAIEALTTATEMLKGVG